MLEAKLKKCEEETADRNREVEALRNVMREKTEQERNLKEENRKLHEQVRHHYDVFTPHIAFATYFNTSLNVVYIGF